MIGRGGICCASGVSMFGGDWPVLEEGGGGDSSLKGPPGNPAVTMVTNTFSTTTKNTKLECYNQMITVTRKQYYGD